MRLCIVGNSHVAALRAAQGADTTLAGHDVDFFSVPGGRQPIVEVVAGRIRPTAAKQGVLTSVPGAETDGLDMAGFDALVISACGLIAARNGHVVPDPKLHPCGALACAAWAWDNPGVRPEGPQLVSSAVFEVAVEDYVRDHASVQLVTRLADCFAGPVLVQPWPAPNRSLRCDREWFVNQWYGAAGPAAWAAFFAAQRRALTRVATSLGPRFIFLDYPSLAGASQPIGDGFMDGDWCEADPWHGNARYGALVLDQIVQALD